MLGSSGYWMLGSSRHGMLGFALQIQCYQCEEFQPDDCSSPEFIVNCTVNVQNMCQKEVMEKSDGKSIVVANIPILLQYSGSGANSAACSGTPCNPPTSALNPGRVVLPDCEPCMISLS
uniref:Ly6/PLAUR domain-containing protein 1 n=1 Tax=Leptobrachium leishanense TaxID=445787 RepID=A0A8C5MR88_9ANUR